jgi:hypothetical protein
VSVVEKTKPQIGFSYYELRAVPGIVASGKSGSIAWTCSISKVFSLPKVPFVKVKIELPPTITVLVLAVDR